MVLLVLYMLSYISKVLQSGCRTHKELGVTGCYKPEKQERWRSTRQAKYTEKSVYIRLKEKVSSPKGCC